MYMVGMMLGLVCWTFLGLLAWSLAVHGAAGPAKLVGMFMDVKKRLMK